MGFGETNCTAMQSKNSATKQYMPISKKTIFGISGRFLQIWSRMPVYVYMYLKFNRRGTFHGSLDYSKSSKTPTSPSPKEQQNNINSPIQSGRTNLDPPEATQADAQHDSSSRHREMSPVSSTTELSSQSPESPLVSLIAQLYSLIWRLHVEVRCSFGRGYEWII